MARRLLVKARFEVDDAASVGIGRLERSVESLDKELDQLNDEFKKGTATTKDYTKAVGKLENEQKSLETQTGKLSGEQSKLENGLGKLKAGYLAVVGTIAAVVAGTVKAVQANNDYERSLKAVGAALDVNGKNTEANVDAVAAFATQLERATGVVDTEILALFNLGRAFTGTTAAAQKLTKAALDFSAAAGISTEEALRRLGRSLGGSIEDIANYDSRIRLLTKSQLAAGEAIDLVADKFRDFLSDQRTDLDVKLDKIIASASETIRIFGRLITKLTELLSIFQLVDGALTAVNNSVRIASDSWKQLLIDVGLTKDVFKEADEAAKTLETGLLGLVNKFELNNQATKDLATNFAGLVSAGFDADDALKSLERTLERSARLTKEFSDATVDLQVRMKELGVTLDVDLNKQIAENNRLIEISRDLFRETDDEGYLDFIQRATAENAKLQAQLDGTTEAAKDSKDAFDQSTEAFRRNADQAGITANALDQLAISQRQLTAGNAALNARDAATGGGRVRLPGGGSRLVRPDGRGGAFTDFNVPAPVAVDGTGLVN